MIPSADTNCADQYQYVCKRKQLLPVIYAKYFEALPMHLFEREAENVTQNQLDPFAFAAKVRLETFFRCCAPVCSFLLFLKQPHYQLQEPLTAIVSFKHPTENYHSVNMQFTTWVQSGGTRTVPLNIYASKESVYRVLDHSHAVIIPDMEGFGQSSEKLEEYWSNLYQLLSSYSKLPVLAFGSSALKMLSLAYPKQMDQLNKKLQSNKTKQFNPATSFYLSHQNPMFSDLTLETRLAIENQGKVNPTRVTLSVQQFYNCHLDTQLKILGIHKSRDEVWQCSLIQNTNGVPHSYFAYWVPHMFQNAEAIAMSHKLIAGFMDNVRQFPGKQVKGKSPLQIQQYRLVLCPNKTDHHYNVDTPVGKLNK